MERVERVSDLALLWSSLELFECLDNHSIRPKGASLVPKGDVQLYRVLGTFMMGNCSLEWFRDPCEYLKERRKEPFPAAWVGQ